MVRFLLACLVAMTMLVNPVAASAARMECDKSQPAKMSTMAATMPGMPCCDHDKVPAKPCAKLCDMFQSVSVALPPVIQTVQIFSQPATAEARATAALQYFEPGTLDPPPRLQA
jgi:hypothetical protein